MNIQNFNALTFGLNVVTKYSNGKIIATMKHGSLPYRQLRKYIDLRNTTRIGSLPYRQLRNYRFQQ